MEDQLILTDEERILILNRRKLQKERALRRNSAPKNQAKAAPVQQKQEPKQPNGWDAHKEPDRIHRGRLTEDHPLGWFEPEIFRKIGNMEHKAEHKKIPELLKMPIQTKSRDRVYHALCHLDVLWTEAHLPLKYKHKYEEYKKEHSIGDDNIHPSHKKEGEKYPVAQNKRPWSAEDHSEFNDKEKFIVGKVYKYAKAA